MGGLTQENKKVIPVNQLTNYYLVRTKRKTLSIEINDLGALIIRSPKNLSKIKIEQLVHQKAKWINKKQSELKKQNRRERLFQTGETFLYLGKSYTLKINQTQRLPLIFNNKYFSLKASAIKNAHAVFHHWYRINFATLALPRIKQKIQKQKFSMQRLNIRYAKTCWGSCSPENNIMLNYLLLMSPIEVIDYVINHELCHTIYKNHAPAFWQLLQNIMPHYKYQQTWLKENTYKLQLEWLVS